MTSEVLFILGTSTRCMVEYSSFVIVLKVMERQVAEIQKIIKFDSWRALHCFSDDYMRWVVLGGLGVMGKANVRAEPFGLFKS